MRGVTRLAAGAAVLAAFALPATAAAEKPSVKTVKKHVRSADRSLDKVVRYVKQNRDAAADREVRRVSRSLRTASKQASRVRTRRGAYRVIGSTGTVANECADLLSGVVGQAGAPAQLDIAKVIRTCLNIRQRIVDLLKSVVDDLPPPAQEIVAGIIAKLTTDGADEVGNLTDALQTPGLPIDVAAIVADAINLATQAIDMAADILDQVLGVLPVDLSGIITSALSMVTGQLSSVTTMITDLLNNVLGGLFGGGQSGDAPSGSNPLGGLFGGSGGFGFIGDLLNSVLGNLPFLGGGLFGSN